MAKLEPPDLQEWIDRFGGYANIPWPEWDAANQNYQVRRREELEREWAQSGYRRAKT